MKHTLKKTRNRTSLFSSNKKKLNNILVPIFIINKFVHMLCRVTYDTILLEGDQPIFVCLLYIRVIVTKLMRLIKYMFDFPPSTHQPTTRLALSPKAYRGVE